MNGFSNPNFGQIRQQKPKSKWYDLKALLHLQNMCQIGTCVCRVAWVAVFVNVVPFCMDHQIRAVLRVLWCLSLIPEELGLDKVPNAQNPEIETSHFTSLIPELYPSRLSKVGLFRSNGFHLLEGWLGSRPFLPRWSPFPSQGRFSWRVQPRIARLRREYIVWWTGARRLFSLPSPFCRFERCESAKFVNLNICSMHCICMCFFALFIWRPTLVCVCLRPKSSGSQHLFFANGVKV